MQHGEKKHKRQALLFSNPQLLPYYGSVVLESSVTILLWLCCSRTLSYYLYTMALLFSNHQLLPYYGSVVLEPSVTTLLWLCCSRTLSYYPTMALLFSNQQLLPYYGDTSNYVLPRKQFRRTYSIEGTFVSS